MANGETIVVTDDVTGQKHRFPASASRAEIQAAMAKYRGATDKPKQASTWETVKELPGALWSGMKAPYEEEEPSWLMALPRAGKAGIKQLAEDLIGAGRVTGRILTPPFMRSEEEPSRGDVLSIPDLLTGGPLFGGIGRGVGEAAYAATGSPGVAAGAEQVGMLGAPHALSRLPQLAQRSGLLGKFGRMMEQKPLPGPRPTMEAVEHEVETQYGRAAAPEAFGKKFRAKYYPEAEQLAKSDVQKVYNTAERLVAGQEVDPKEFLEFLPKSEAGIAAQVAPFPGERMQARTAAVAKSMITDEEEAYAAAMEKIGGRGGTFTPENLARMNPEAQKAIMAEVLGELPVAENKPIPMSDLVHLRARINGALRASSSVNNDAIARNLRQFKARIEAVLPGDALQALKDADFLYATRVIPSFGPGGVLRRMQYNDAAKIADSLVPKGRTELRPTGGYRKALMPRPIEEYLGKLSPEGRSNLRAAWFSNRMAEAAGDPEKLVKVLGEYSPSVLENFLGAQYAPIKQLAETAARLKPQMSHWSWKRGLGGAIGASTVFQLSYAIKDAIEAVVFGTSRGTPYAILGAGHALAATAGLMMANPKLFAKVATRSTQGANAIRQILVARYDNPNLPNLARNIFQELRAAQQAEERESGD